jgi:hypothetical protein
VIQQLTSLAIVDRHQKRLQLVLASQPTTLAPSPTAKAMR